MQEIEKYGMKVLLEKEECKVYAKKSITDIDFIPAVKELLALLKTVNDMYSATIHSLVEILISSQESMTEEEKSEVLKELFTEE